MCLLSKLLVVDLEGIENIALSLDSFSKNWKHAMAGMVS